MDKFLRDSIGLIEREPFYCIECRGIGNGRDVEHEHDGNGQ